MLLRFFTKETCPYYCCFLHTKKVSGGVSIYRIHKLFPLKPSLKFRFSKKATTFDLAGKVLTKSWWILWTNLGLFLISIVKFLIHKGVRYMIKFTSTDKWIQDRSTFASIKPKHDSQLFVDLCIFTSSYMLLCVANLKLF